MFVGGGGDFAGSVGMFLPDMGGGEVNHARRLLVDGLGLKDGLVGKEGEGLGWLEAQNLKKMFEQ